MAGRRIASLVAAGALLGGACGGGGEGSAYSTTSNELAEPVPIETWKAQPETRGVKVSATLEKYRDGSNSVVMPAMVKSDSRLTTYNYWLTANISSATPPTGCAVLYWLV